MAIEPITIAGTVDTKALSLETMEWARNERGLSPETLELLGVRSGTAYFPDVGRKERAIFFPFQKGWKARSIESKQFVAGGGFKAAFWNLEAVLLAKPGTVYITEGELDAAALVEAGLPDFQVLSVPTGAKERPDDAEFNPKTYAYVDDALRAGLSAVQRFVWCGDRDTPGLQLREDMARILGPARFMTIDWPANTKDANQVLVANGADALWEIVSSGLKPWPVQGIYTMDELPEPPPLPVWDCGFRSWEGKIQLAPKTFSLVTGNPGHGKTQLFQQIWAQIARRYDIGVCIASFETRPKPHIRRQLRSVYWGRPPLTSAEVEIADKWIADHYLFVLHPQSRPSLGWFLDMAEVAVVRHGVKVIQLDPWNRLEAARGRDENETEYILRCLREMYSFANDMNVHVQVIAHPAKMDQRRRGDAPTLEDISGSKHWENISDQGFSVYRPEIFDGTTRKTECSLFHLKSRFEELGYACKVDLNFDLQKGMYVSRDTSDIANMG